MKRIFAALVISLIAISASAQEHLKVKGIPIDGSTTSFIAKLKAAGLKTNARLTEAIGSPILEGDFANLSNCKFSFLETSNGTVCKVLIMSNYITGWFSCKNKYDDLKELLSTKYNVDGVYEVFKSPYEEGDGYELSAISQEKGLWETYFSCPEGHISISIEASNTKEGYISVIYEDQTNMAKFVAEREKKLSDDI